MGHRLALRLLGQRFFGATTLGDVDTNAGDITCYRMSRSSET